MKYEINMDAKIKGFITNLGKYNEGELMGMWISFPVDEDELETVYSEIGINEEYEEVFFTDWEYDDIECDFGEYENIEHVNYLAEQLEILTEYDIEKLGVYLEAINDDLEEALNELDRCTFWNGYSLEEVAQELAEECGDLRNVPGWIACHIDWEGVARELGCDGYYEASNGVLCYQ